MAVPTSVIADFILAAKEHTAQFPLTLSDAMIAKFGRDPFRILCSCLISLRARDTITTPICLKFFEKVSTPEQLRVIPQEELERVFFSVGFYKTKAQVLREVSVALCERFGGSVPQTEAELLRLPGVGRKTANLVLSMAFEVPAICVDVHVHRLANALGWVATKTPEETELALQKMVPQDLWGEVNRQLVLLGQNGCLGKKKSGHVCPLLTIAKI